MHQTAFKLLLGMLKMTYTQIVKLICFCFLAMSTAQTLFLKARVVMHKIKQVEFRFSTE